MSRWISVLVVAFIILVLACISLVSIQRARIAAAMLGCQNNLREVALFAGRFAAMDPKRPAFTNKIPAGTITNPALPPEDRLSWYVTALPWLDQQQLPAPNLIGRIDLAQSWNAAPNAEVAKLRLNVLICPSQPPRENANGPTSYFGTAGLGENAATLRVREADLRLGNFGNWSMWVIPREAGCFRYDSPTPFEAITDGLSQTIMIGEREPSPGPWLQGGPSTVRGYEASRTPPIGPGGEFGGGHPAAANFAYADGHVQPLSIAVSPDVLKSQLTIADGNPFIE